MSSPLLVQGVHATTQQINTAKAILDEAKSLQAATKVMQALMFAAIAESSMGAAPGTWSDSYAGPLQGDSTYFSQFGSVSSSAVMVQQVTDFVKGGHGFNPDPGGATSIQGSYTDIGKLAAAVERPTINGSLVTGYGQYYNQNVGGVTGQPLMNMYINEALAWVTWYGGGSALNTAGGTSSTTGKSRSKSPFYVGGPSNPSEDVWTAINRLAQERYWYIFSDGELVYLADGSIIMQQPPAAKIDRWGDLDKIIALSFNWDNTAWQYAYDTHKAKKHTVRKTQLTKISSPVEAELQLICEIDAVRAGDVIELSGCGPGDGRWLVGTARRSIFDIYSELDLVPAVKALTEGQAEIAIGAISNADVPGAAAGKTSGTVINTLWTACDTIADLGLPYVSFGGRTQAGHPDSGKPGEGYYDGKTQGYDAAGAVAADLASAGFVTGSVPDGPGLIDNLLKKNLLIKGKGSGVPEYTVYHNSHHFFVYINAFGTGRYWGSNDGGPGPLFSDTGALNDVHPIHWRGQTYSTYPSSEIAPGFSPGAVWLEPPPSLSGYETYHIPQNILGDNLNNTNSSTTPGNYVNPFGKATLNGRHRIDMGVDFELNDGDPILAIGNATVWRSSPLGSSTGWPGTGGSGTPGGDIYYALKDGSLAGKSIYVGECISPTVSSGATVTAGQTIAKYVTGESHLEIGWADPARSGHTLATVQGQDSSGAFSGEPGDWSSHAGISFMAFLVSLGVPQNAAYQVGDGNHGSPNPPGYPPG